MHDPYHLMKLHRVSTRRDLNRTYSAATVLSDYSAAGCCATSDLQGLEWVHSAKERRED